MGVGRRGTLLTWLHDPWFCSQVCQIHIGLPAINDGVGILAGSFGSSPVSHGDLSNIHTQTYTQSSKSTPEETNNRTGEVIPVNKTEGQGVLNFFFLSFFWGGWNLSLDPPSKTKQKKKTKEERKKHRLLTPPKF